MAPRASAKAAANVGSGGNDSGDGNQVQILHYSIVCLHQRSLPYTNQAPHGTFGKMKMHHGSLEGSSLVWNADPQKLGMYTQTRRLRRIGAVQQPIRFLHLSVKVLLPIFFGWTLPQTHMRGCAFAVGDHGIMPSLQGSGL